MAHDAARGVARVYYQFGGIDDGYVIVARVIRRNDDSVIASEGLRIQRDGLHVFVVVVAHFVKLREIGVVVFEVRAALLKQLHDLERGRFAQVVDVLFVRHAENQQLRSLRLFLWSLSAVAMASTT